MVFCRPQQIVLLALALAAAIIHVKRPLHSPLPKPQAQRQWAIEITGTVAYPGIHTFDMPPTLFQALEQAGLMPTQDLLPKARPEEVQTGTHVQVVRHPHGSCRICVTPMAPKKMLALGIPLHVNETTTEHLALVPGISLALAQRIVTLRQATGPFKTWDDLRQVKGVGPAKIETLRYYFSVP